MHTLLDWLTSPLQRLWFGAPCPKHAGHRVREFATQSSMGEIEGCQECLKEKGMRIA
jgi:hypothetical protein